MQCESREGKGRGKNMLCDTTVKTRWWLWAVCCQGNERKQFEEGKKPDKHLVLMVKWVNYIFWKLISWHAWFHKERETANICINLCVCTCCERVFLAQRPLYHSLWSTRRCTRRMLKANLLSTKPFLSLLKGNNYPALELSVCCRAWWAVLRTYSVFVHAGSKMNISQVPNTTKVGFACHLADNFKEM